MFFISPTITSIILNNVSLAHINNDGWYAIDEIFKDVCGIFQGLQVKKFCLQYNLLCHLSKPHFPSYREVHVNEEASISFVLGHLGILMYLQGSDLPRRKIFVTTIVKECVLYFCKPTIERPWLYTPLPISSYPWEIFLVDFIRELPMSSMSHVYLCVAVDRLCDKQVVLLLSQYVRVHFGLSMFIISSQESRLLGKYWTNLWQLMDTMMGRSIYFHP
jgi:hydrogenase maturation factor